MLSGGRTIFVACQGQAGPGGGNFAEEFAAFHIEPASRMCRMEEAIEILRLTSSQEEVSYQGEYNEFSHITVLPRPVQQPIPIWIAANPLPTMPKMGERALRRVAKYGDGWMTTLNTPQSFAQNLASLRHYAQEEGRDLSPHFEVCLYYNINVNEDREAAFQESKHFLDTYYSVDYPPSRVEMGVALGSPQQCIDRLQEFIDAGATTITLRLTSYDRKRQFDHAVIAVCDLDEAIRRYQALGFDVRPGGMLCTRFCSPPLFSWTTEHAIALRSVRIRTEITSRF